MILALAGDLALVPWSRQWHPASERACLDWRKALGPAPLEELQATVLAAAAGEHRDRAPASPSPSGRPGRWPCTRPTGRCCGSPTRRPTGPRSGSVGTADDSAAVAVRAALPAEQLPHPVAARDAARARRDGQDRLRAAAS